MFKNYSIFLVITLIAFTCMVVNADTYLRPPALIEGYTTTAKASGTTTLTRASQTQQSFTGTGVQTVVLPDATTLDVGQKFYIYNVGASGLVTVQSSGGGALGTIPGTYSRIYSLRAKATAAGTWDVITMSVDGFTSGSVLFAGTEGQITQDNSNFFWDDTNNRLGIGGGASDNTVTIGGSSYGMLFHASAEGGTDLAEFGLHRHSATAGFGPFLVGVRSRGTEASETAVASGDSLFRLIGTGHDGTDYEQAAAIYYDVDGTPGANDMPGRIEFFTTLDGSATLSERMRIANTGYVGIGDTSPDTALDVTLNDATTTTAPAVASFYHNTSGTPGTNFGLKMDFFADSATVEEREVFNITGIYTDATDATRTVDMTINKRGTAGVEPYFRAGRGGGRLSEAYGYSAITTVLSGTTSFGIINGDSTADNVAKLTFSSENTADAAFIASQNRNLYLGTGNSTTIQMGMNNTTNFVGIGSAIATAPANKLHIDAGTATATYAQFTANATTGQTSSDGFLVGIDATGKANINQQKSAALGIYTAGTERISVTSGGLVGIGTTGPTQELSFGAAGSTISTDTSDGADNDFLNIAGGGSESVTRGGVISLSGNEEASTPGQIVMNGGYYTGTTNANIVMNDKFYVGDVNVGIGDTTPDYILDIKTTGADYVNLISDMSSSVDVGYVAQGHSTSGSPKPTFYGASSRGTEASPTATQSGDYLARIVGQGYGTSFQNGAFIDMTTTQLWSATNQGSQIAFSVNQNNTTTPDEVAVIKGSNISLDLTATDQGLKLNVVSAAGPLRGSTSTKGQLVYDDAVDGLAYYNGSAWEFLSPVACLSTWGVGVATNASSVSLTNAYCHRAGSRVFFTAVGAITPTGAGTQFTVSMDLALASNFTGSSQAMVVCNANQAGYTSIIASADTTNDWIQITGRSFSTSAMTVACSGSYNVQ